MSVFGCSLITTDVNVPLRSEYSIVRLLTSPKSLPALWVYSSTAGWSFCRSDKLPYICCTLSIWPILVLSLASAAAFFKVSNSYSARLAFRSLDSSIGVIDDSSLAMSYSTNCGCISLRCDSFGLRFILPCDSTNLRMCYCTKLIRRISMT